MTTHAGTLWDRYTATLAALDQACAAEADLRERGHELKELFWTALRRGDTAAMQGILLAEYRFIEEWDALATRIGALQDEAAALAWQLRRERKQA